MKLIITSLILLFSAWNFSYGQSSACDNAKLKEAELAAYQALIKARADAAKTLSNDIDGIERTKKDGQATANTEYLEALKKCGTDAKCPGAKKIEYDDAVFIVDAFAKGQLTKAQNKEKIANEDAQKDYDEAVKKAKELYPPTCFQASGQDGPTVYSGTVCDTRMPFELTGTNGPLIYPFKFTPTSDSTGTFSFISQYSGVVWKGTGTYIIKGLKTGKARMDTESTTTVTTPGGTSSGSGPGHINLDCKN